MPKIHRSEQDLLKLMEWRQPAKGSRPKEAAFEAGRRLPVLDHALRVAFA